jgi:hypothetical protein
MRRAVTVSCLVVALLRGCGPSEMIDMDATPCECGVLGKIALEVAFNADSPYGPIVEAYLINVSQTPVYLPQWTPGGEDPRLSGAVSLYMRDGEDWICLPRPEAEMPFWEQMHSAPLSFSMPFEIESREEQRMLWPGERDLICFWEAEEYLTDTETPEAWCSLLFPYVFEGTVSHEAGILLRSNVVSLAPEIAGASPARGSAMAMILESPILDGLQFRMSQSELIELFGEANVSVGRFRDLSSGGTEERISLTCRGPDGIVFSWGQDGETFQLFSITIEEDSADADYRQDAQGDEAMASASEVAESLLAMDELRHIYLGMDVEDCRQTIGEELLCEQPMAVSSYMPSLVYEVEEGTYTYIELYCPGGICERIDLIFGTENYEMILQMRIAAQNASIYMPHMP